LPPDVDHIRDLRQTIDHPAELRHIRHLGREAHAGTFIALNLLIGLSCALPAYLYAVTPSNRESARA